MKLEELTAKQLRAIRPQLNADDQSKIDRLLQQQEPDTAPPLTPFPGRIAITLPWSALAPDNLNVGVAGDANREKRASFKAAKLRAIDIMREAYGGAQTAGPVRVTGTFWFPDNRPRDPLNFGKAVMDALKEVVVTDDRWQVCRRVVVEAGGIDRDRPRCELVIEAIG